MRRAISVMLCAVLLGLVGCGDGAVGTTAPATSTTAVSTTDAAAGEQAFLAALANTLAIPEMTSNPAAQIVVPMGRTACEVLDQGRSFDDALGVLDSGWELFAADAVEQGYFGQDEFSREAVTGLLQAAALPAVPTLCPQHVERVIAELEASAPTTSG